ncbi:FHA domain-containing protein [Okeania sp.]|uniref:FHA domain-containing protein n=1 Tax=Okeania sp. TaxID=3100323 RepID=UPI002B4AB2BF|nr:FHA domain-containing protein [Okeania sp.]MEB3341758.1 FHA domain-containing protein [Okeania sp.]
MKLILLHPLQSMPIKSWTFDDQPVIKIGRSPDNDVVIYSSVVSRHHLELKTNHSGWEIINLGSNGTYINGKPIKKVKVVNGLIVNLAPTGPKIAIYLDDQSKEVNFKQKHNYQNGLDKFETELLKEVLNRESREPDFLEDTTF